MKAIQTLGTLVVAGALVGCQEDKDIQVRMQGLTDNTRDRLNELVVLSDTAAGSSKRTLVFHGQLQGSPYTIQVDVGAERKITNFAITSQNGNKFFDNTPDTIDIMKGTYRQGETVDSLHARINTTNPPSVHLSGHPARDVRQMAWELVSNIPLDSTQWTKEAVEASTNVPLEGKSEDAPVEKQ